MATLLKPSPPSDVEEGRSDGALEYYAKHTAQIEVKGIPYCETLFNYVLSPLGKDYFVHLACLNFALRVNMAIFSRLLLHSPTKFISIMK